MQFIHLVLFWLHFVTNMFFKSFPMYTLNFPQFKETPTAKTFFLENFMAKFVFLFFHLREMINRPGFVADSAISSSVPQFAEIVK